VDRGSTHIECDGITRANLTQTNTSRTRILFNVTSTLSLLNYVRQPLPTATTGYWVTAGNTIPLPDGFPPFPTSCVSLSAMHNISNMKTKFEFDSEACDEIRRDAMSSTVWDGEPYGWEDPYPCLWQRQCGFVASPNEVILLYWPEKEDLTKTDCSGPDTLITSSLKKRNTGAPVTTIVTNITFRGQDLYSRCAWPEGLTQFYSRPGFDMINEFANRHCGNPGGFGPWTYINTSVLAGTWTFTSPNVYLAHHPVTVEDGRFYTTPRRVYTWPAGVIEINKADVSTVINVPNKPANFAQLVAKGLYQGPVSLEGGPPSKTLPLNFRDLHDPVPAASYFDGRSDCFGRNTHCGTITDGSFRPELVLKRTLWSKFLPKDRPCHVFGVIDPVIALEPVGPTQKRVEELKITLPVPSSRPSEVATPPEPGRTPGQQWPNPTPRPVPINNGGRRPDYGPPHGDNGVIEWPLGKGSSNREPDRGHGFQGLVEGFDIGNDQRQGGGLGLDSRPGSNPYGRPRNPVMGTGSVYGGRPGSGPGSGGSYGELFQLPHMPLAGSDSGYEGRPGWGTDQGWRHGPRFHNAPGWKNGGGRPGKGPAGYTGGSIRHSPESQLSMWVLALMVCLLDFSGNGLILYLFTA
jgi:hypothetical protein